MLPVSDLISIGQNDENGFTIDETGTDVGIVEYAQFILRWLRGE
jgi:hypothetical protein